MGTQLKRSRPVGRKDNEVKRFQEPPICSKLRKLGRIIYSLKYPILSAAYIIGLIFAVVFPVGYATFVYLKLIEFDPWHLALGLLLSLYLLAEKKIAYYFEEVFFGK